MAFHWLDVDVAYLKGLAAAGFEGIRTARHEMYDSVTEARPERVLWPPAALGGALGALGARLIGKRKSASAVALGGLVGSMVGCGAALAWSSRGLAGPCARGAARRVNALRDARWLAANPIDYA